MEYFGLLIEIIFLLMGLYLYLFSRGVFQPSEPAAQRRAEEFRQRNGWWLRLIGLLLMAIMAVNIFFHVQDLLGG